MCVPSRAGDVVVFRLGRRGVVLGQPEYDADLGARSGALAGAAVARAAAAAATFDGSAYGSSPSRTAAISALTWACSRMSCRLVR